MPETLTRAENFDAIAQDEPALLGGPQGLTNPPGDLLTWPIVTQEDEDAVLGVLRRGAMSGTEVTMQFEKEFAAWQGTRYALGFSSGTASIQTAMFACGVGVGDEIICPSVTYWASALQCFSLGATVVFAEIDEATLCIDPADIEHRITPRTKAIVVVHYAGYPCDMDPILEIARRHNVKVIEDVSHAQGGLYKGRKVGTLGDVGAMSLMSGKSFAIGEAGILVADDLEIYERSMAFGHYERFSPGFTTEALRPLAGLPLGGYKYRMHQLSSAMGLVQLKYYDARCAEIDRSMKYFGELIEDVPGIRLRQVKDEGCNMAGWYHPLVHYTPEELGGLSVRRFAEAVSAEGVACIPGCNFPLHLHAVFNEADVYGHGKPTRIANTSRDVRQGRGSLPVSERINARMCTAPHFRHYRPEAIAEYAAVYRKVALNYEALLEGDEAPAADMGSLSFTKKNV